MTTHLHFDLVGGIAGDMTVAALLDAGADADELCARLERSGLPHTGVRIERDQRAGLVGNHFHVDPEVDPPHRHWSEIRTLLEGSSLTPGARDLALRIFAALARAEAGVHGCTPDDVHFHEVGAMDSIVDITATAIAIDMLGATSFSCSAVPVCQGTVETAHGTLPLPTPATALLLTGFQLLPIEGDLETVTPTGAAILATLVPDGRGHQPRMRLLAVGTGLGSAQLARRANALRILRGEVVPHDGRADRDRPDVQAVEISAAIDDMDPRLYASVVEHLFAAGALDVTLAPLQMKKQRPGTLLGVLCPPELEGVLSGIVLRETTTLGVRSHDVRRTVLERRTETVQTPFGAIRVKLGLLGNEVVNVSPEYDDCEGIAREREVALKDVLAAACAAASELGFGAGRPPGGLHEEER